MTEDMPLDVSYVPSTYLTEISHISQALSEVEQLLNAPELCAKDFEDLFKQEESLKVKAQGFLWSLLYDYCTVNKLLIILGILKNYKIVS